MRPGRPCRSGLQHHRYQVRLLLLSELHILTIMFDCSDAITMGTDGKFRIEYYDADARWLMIFQACVTRKTQNIS